MVWHKLVDEFLSRMKLDNIPLRLALWDGMSFDFSPNPQVTITARSVAGLKLFLSPKLNTLGQAYVEGDLDIDGEVDQIIEVAAKLAERAGPGDGREPPAARRHSKALDKAAIAYHYDVSNEFYQLWLDPNMVYSCAYFREPTDTLEQAQLQKLDHILTKLQLKPGQRLLDIGCGWGALMLSAAERYGAKVTGITLSQQQYDLARERIKAAGLQDRCEVRLEDYRDTQGKFDRITSVGMFEHVGLANLEAYFRRIHTLLEDGGVVMNHGITSTDINSGEAPLGGSEFISEYVFPHGELPHLNLTLTEMCRAGLEPVDVESLRRHYALTLKHWSQRLEAASEPAREMVGERLYRIWRVYLAGCAYGFEQDWMSLYQILAVKAGGPGMNPLPLTREYMYRG
jgi:cyclopropane-fatty-acyl-phospholipid synthase